MINKGKIMDIYSNKDFSKRLRILLFFAFLTSCSSVFAMDKESSSNDEKLQKAVTNAFMGSISKDDSAKNIEYLLKLKELRNKPEAEKLFIRKDPEVEYAQKLAKLTGKEKESFEKEDNKKKFINKIIKKNESLDQLDEDIDDALQHLVTNIARKYAPLEAKDVVMRGFLGKNWKILADLNPEGYGDALGYLAIFKASEVFGKHIDSTIEKSMGEVLDNTFGGILGGAGKLISFTYRSIRNLIKGRSGMPFSPAELNLLRDSVKQTFIELEKVLSKSSIMDARSRDKIVRGEEIEVESVDPLWLGQKIGLVKQLDFWSQILKKRALYYDPSSDESIVFYASQIVDALEDINKNFVTPSKSQKEFGSSANQQAIQIRRSIIDINFGNLIKYISPRTADDKGSSKEGSLSSSLIRNGRRDNDLL